MAYRHRAFIRDGAAGQQAECDFKVCCIKMEYRMLFSKIQIPELQKNLIIRERLLKKLDNLTQPIVILHGTVGYGKTVLMSQYVSLYEIPCAWYHLDTMDNDMRTFLEYLTVALKSIWKDFSFSAEEYIQSGTMLPIERIAMDFTACMNELLQHPEYSRRKVAIVLDDFQAIENLDIFFFISRFMTYALKNLRLFIATKSRLPEFAAAHLVRDEAGIVSMEELAFNWDEVSNVLEKILHEDIPPGISGNIYKKAEGWPAGTMFMAQYLKRAGGAGKFVDWDGIGGATLIQHYIMNELFRKLPYDIQQFLIKTSVLDELCVSLCNYALNMTNARSTLNYLIQENLFILRIDKSSGYYRYHSLFKMFLAQSIFPEQKKEILDRAASWYLKNGNTDRALECWIQNDNRDEVEKYYKRFAPVLMREKQDGILQRCRAYLSPEETGLKNKENVLKLRYFGGFSVQLGEDRHEMAWRTKKTAELFACLALRGGRPIRRDELLKLLWPEDFPNNAVAMLHNMFYNIRKELLPYGQNERIQYVNKEYSMNMSDVVSDLEEIDSGCAAVESKDVAALAENARLFFKPWGIFLEGIEGSWCLMKRYYYEKCFLEGCELLGEYFIKKEQYHTAVRVLRAGLDADTYSETLAMLLMKCYARLQERKEGKRLYEELCHVWRTELGIAPGRAFTRAYEECMRG